MKLFKPYNYHNEFNYSIILRLFFKLVHAGLRESCVWKYALWRSLLNLERRDNENIPLKLQLS